MALRIRFQYPTANTIGYSIEQLSSGYFYDSSLMVFVPRSKTNAANMIATLSEDVAPFVGRYFTTLYATPNFVFIDGDYVVTIHDMKDNSVIAELSCTMRNGDDQSC